MNTTVTLQSTYTELISLLGKPMLEASAEGQLVLYYQSEAPTLADYYIFEHTRLVFLSHSYYTAPKILTEYTGLYGPPAYSVWKYKSDTPDSLRTIVHVWPQSGRAVTTVDGTSQAAHVIREDQFTPVSLTEYLASWGKDVSGHQVATISAVSSPSPMVTYIPTAGLEGKSSLPGDLLLGFVALVLVLCVVLIIKKMFFHRNQGDKGDQREDK